MSAGTSANYPEERPDDMDPAEPDGITSAPTPHPNLHPSLAPAGAVTKGRLQSLEQNLLVLERNYGATHPQVMLSIMSSPDGMLHNNLCWVIKAAAFSQIYVQLMPQWLHKAACILPQLF